MTNIRSHIYQILPTSSIAHSDNQNPRHQNPHATPEVRRGLKTPVGLADKQTAPWTNNRTTTKTKETGFFEIFARCNDILPKNPVSGPEITNIELIGLDNVPS
jgi:hypothetical protein